MAKVLASPRKNDVMASLSRQGPDQPIVGINVTPLVDITLVLLIIFMVTAKLVVSRGLPLDLPQATQGEAVQQVFQVGIDEDGATSANGHAVSDEEALVVRAREALAAHPALRAVISAHRLARHERVMAALDALRRAGLAQVAFAVTARPETEP
ncbi:MAG: hypothetical protein RL385_173 [Pseudomonadota bacterium]|jgi:biopolymer transport protein ExbD